MIILLIFVFTTIIITILFADKYQNQLSGIYGVETINKFAEKAGKNLYTYPGQILISNIIAYFTAYFVKAYV